MFGADARRDWWALDADDKRDDLKEVCRRLEASSRYIPRFAGGAEPLLVRWYRTVQKLANQYLHHTAVGLHVRLERGERVPTSYFDPSLPFWVCFCSYWTLAQQVYLQLLVEGLDAGDFNAIFVNGFASFTEFLRTLGKDVPDLVIEHPPAP